MTYGSESETKRKPKKKEDLVPEGPHIGRCYSVIDLGTQKTEYKGEVKWQRKIQITWEIPSLMKVFNEDKGEQPMIVGRKYTASSYGESHLAKDFSSWFAGDQPDGDIFALVNKHTLGRTAVLTIQHDSFEVGRDTIHFQKIVSVTPLMEGQTCPEQINESLQLDLDDFNQEAFDKIPEWQQKMIEESPEWRQAKERVDEDEFDDLITEEAKAEGIASEKQDDSDELPF